MAASPPHPQAPHGQSEGEIKTLSIAAARYKKEPDLFLTLEASV